MAEPVEGHGTTKPSEMALVAPKRFGPAPRLVEMKAPEDDWSGVTRQADRRRRQNRLNQRAYRRRQLAQNEAENEDGGKAEAEAEAEASDQPERATAAGQGYELVPLSARARAGAEAEARTGAGSLLPPSDGEGSGWLMIDRPWTRAATYAFMQFAHIQYTLRNHSLAYLPSLIRLNAINALSKNAWVIGLSPHRLCHDDMLSPFNALGPKPLHTTPPEDAWPENMRPTALQRTIQHHPWTDLLPAPQLRDNVLGAIASGAIDEDDLCLDLMEITKSDQDDAPYLIVWGEPSRVDSWEVSVGFLKKWGWLLRGCPELIQSTNRWRLKRGEKAFDVRV